MASYLAYYGGAGLGPSHRYFRSRGVEASPAVQTDLRTEYGKNNLGFGVYFSITPWEYTVDDIFVNTATLGKAGVYFKYYVLKLSSRLRPYARVGAGINIEGDIPEKYQRRFNFQVRAGADYYLLRFFGFHAETGFGAGNIVSLGIVYRIPFSARG